MQVQMLCHQPILKSFLMALSLSICGLDYPTIKCYVIVLPQPVNISLWEERRKLLSFPYLIEKEMLEKIP